MCVKTYANSQTLSEIQQQLAGQNAVVSPFSGRAGHLSRRSPVWHTHGMNTRHATDLYKHHRFPVEIISHCMWLYDRFSLSYRNVEELMAERGVTLSHEAVRYWWRKFLKVYNN